VLIPILVVGITAVAVYFYIYKPHAQVKLMDSFANENENSFVYKGFGAEAECILEQSEDENDHQE